MARSILAIGTAAWMGVMLSAWPASAASPGAETAFVVSDISPGGPPGVTVVTVVTNRTSEIPLTRMALRESGGGYALAPGDALRSPRRVLTFVRQRQALLNLEGGSVLEILPPAGEPSLRLSSGRLWFESRGERHQLRVETPYGVAYFEGTKFQLAVHPGKAEASLLLVDGVGMVTNALGTLPLKTGEAAILSPGAKPRSAQLGALNQVIRWTFYYPGVLDVSELPWPGPIPGELVASLDRYRSGDLVGAASAFPSDRAPTEVTEGLYRAATLLSVGAVEEAEGLLALPLPDGVLDPQREKLVQLRRAFAVMMAAVRHEESARPSKPELATEWLAESYYQQSRPGPLRPGNNWEATFYAGTADNVSRALRAASQATNASGFGFGWVRVAELEFSRGRLPEAERILSTAAAELNPENAQAAALQGFIAAARGRWPASYAQFQRAIDLDPGLANGWLGRGLWEVHQRKAAALDDLQTAATQEPQQATVRSYLAKGYQSVGQWDRAAEEIALAKRSDPGDPTPWLYGALLNQEENRVNEAIADLERSVALNDNRALYRSSLLLDQDRAVRAANLASIYQDAGMPEVSLEQATRAVEDDFANFSGHLFLASSYNAFRDPNLVNLRYETAAASEYLLANLLSPVGGTRLSSQVSENEYGRLFDSGGLGLSSSTLYQSSGSWQEAATQYGTLGRTDYALQLAYGSTVGVAPNTDLELWALSAQVRQQLSPSDVVYLQVIGSRTRTGDVRQYYQQSDLSGTLRTEEVQDPNVFIGYRHEWQPGMVSLALVGVLRDRYELHDDAVSVYSFQTNIDGSTSLLLPALRTFSEGLQSRYEAFSAEFQQMIQAGSHALVGGTRLQFGEVRTSTELVASPSIPSIIYGDEPFPDANRSEFHRISLYGYDTWKIVKALSLTVGLSYDHLRYPKNSDSPPLSDGEVDKDLVAPKAGVVWKPAPATTLRGAYSQSLGGLFYDNSVRLEPSQVAGFLQAYRSLIPESVAGSIPGSRFETGGIALYQEFPTRTYLGVSAEWLRSEADQNLGAFGYAYPNLPLVPSETKTALSYEERSVAAFADQLLGDEWAVGMGFSVADTTLDARWPGLPDPAGTTLQSHAQSILYQWHAHVLFNHPSGFFARLDGRWTGQENQGYGYGTGHESFWQFDVAAGYRFAHRRAELSVALLNLAGEDYRLEPLSGASVLPRERLFALGFRFNL